MSCLSKYLASILILTIAISSLTLMVIKQVNAQSTPAVSVPEFSVKFVDSSYTTPANTSIDPFTGKTVTTPAQSINNQTIEVSIKNQTIPNGTDLYYQVRMKGHHSEQWTIISLAPANPRSEFTILTYAINGNDAPDQFTSHLSQIAPGGTADFQVRAQLMEYNTLPDSQSVPVSAAISASDWSSTQTITIPATSMASPTSQSSSTLNSLAVPELSWFVVVPVLLSVLSVVLVLRQREGSV